MTSKQFLLISLLSISTLAQALVTEIRSTSQFNDVLNSNANTLIVVDFYAKWCGPCKNFAPIFKTMSDSFSDVVFLKVDVDAQEDLARRYSVSSMPTFKFFKNGSLIATVKGANKTSVQQVINQNK